MGRYVDTAYAYAYWRRTRVSSISLDNTAIRDGERFFRNMQPSSHPAIREIGDKSGRFLRIPGIRGDATAHQICAVSPRRRRSADTEARKDTAFRVQELRRSAAVRGRSIEFRKMDNRDNAPPTHTRRSGLWESRDQIQSRTPGDGGNRIPFTERAARS